MTPPYRAALESVQRAGAGSGHRGLAVIRVAVNEDRGTALHFSSRGVVHDGYGLLVVPEEAGWCVIARVDSLRGTTCLPYAMIAKT